MNPYHLGQLVAVWKTSCGRGQRLLGATRRGGEVVVLKEKLTQVALGLNMNLVLSRAVGWIRKDERGLGRDSLGGGKQNSRIGVLYLVGLQHYECIPVEGASGELAGRV